MPRRASVTARLWRASALPGASLTASRIARSSSASLPWRRHAAASRSQANAWSRFQRTASRKAVSAAAHLRWRSSAIPSLKWALTLRGLAAVAALSALSASAYRPSRSERSPRSRFEENPSMAPILIACRRIAKPVGSGGDISGTAPRLRRRPAPRGLEHPHQARRRSHRVPLVNRRNQRRSLHTLGHRPAPAPSADSRRHPLRGGHRGPPRALLLHAESRLPRGASLCGLSHRTRTWRGARASPGPGPLRGASLAFGNARYRARGGRDRRAALAPRRVARGA